MLYREQQKPALTADQLEVLLLNNAVEKLIKAIDDVDWWFKHNAHFSTQAKLIRDKEAAKTAADHLAAVASKSPRQIGAEAGTAAYRKVIADGGTMVEASAAFQREAPIAHKVAQIERDKNQVDAIAKGNSVITPSASDLAIAAFEQWKAAYPAIADATYEQMMLMVLNAEIA